MPGQIDRQIAQRNGLFQAMAIAGRSSQPHHLGAMQYRLAAMERREPLGGERAQFAGLAALSDLHQRFAADEIALLERDEAVEPGLGRGVVGLVLAHPRAERLFEPQRHHRPHPEGPQAKVAPGLDERLVKRDLVARGDVDLVAEIARVADPPDGRRRQPDVHRADREEGERLARNVVAGQPREQVARLGPRDLKPEPVERDVAERDAAFRQMVLEPAHMEGLRGVGGGELEAVGGEAGDGEIADQPALGAQHGRERDPANARHAVGHDAVEPVLGPRAAYLVLAEVMDLVEADALAHGAAFLAHRAESVGAAEARGLERLLALGREVVDVFEPVA